MHDTDTIAPPQAIQHTPGVCGGRACVRMTRIPVWAVVSARHAGVDDASLLHNFPSLTPADLNAAADYYSRHAAEIDADIADQQWDD